jgi:hypothetical protein
MGGKDTNPKIDALAMAVAVTFSGSGFTKGAEDEISFEFRPTGKSNPMNIISVEQNIRLLDDELGCMGFDEAFLNHLSSRIRVGDGKDFILPFEKKFDGIPVEGHAFFELSTTEGLYRLMVFSIKLGEGARGAIRENSFLRAGDELCLREAFNLMDGRSVYREPWFDPAGEGYWISLDLVKTVAGIYPSKYLRNGFKVSKAVTDSYLVHWMSRTDQERLWVELGQGARVRVAAGPEKGSMLIEADPVEAKLKVKDWDGEMTDFWYDNGFWQYR